MFLVKKSICFYATTIFATLDFNIDTAILVLKQGTSVYLAARFLAIILVHLLNSTL